MNWTNYDRLVQHLEAMLARGDDFNYMQGFDPELPGCVDCQCRILMGQRGVLYTTGGKHIHEFLNVSLADAAWLWIPDESDDEDAEEFIGAKGLREALRKLDLVASRYTRPTKTVNSSDFKEPVDRSFVQKCMEIASQPVEVE